MTSRHIFWCICLCGFTLVFACRKDPATDTTTDTDYYALNTPAGFSAMLLPANDSNYLSNSRIALGKRLFNDPQLSRTNEVSCGSCHKPQFAFADSVAIGAGVQGRLGTRNAPTLANVGYLQRLLMEGGVPTLEMQVLVPIQEHNEFDFNILPIVERLAADPSYQQQSQQAYQRPLDAYVLTRAIAAFERTLVSGNSPFDRYTYQQQANALTPQQQAGRLLFMSDSLACSGCHSGFLLTNEAFENNGLYEIYADPGRERLTMNPADRAKFKVPTLRNIAQTAPYMHDGSLPNLSAVIDHYASGGANHPSKSPLVHGFNLSTVQKNDLIAFLHALTDSTFLAGH